MVFLRGELDSANSPDLAWVSGAVSIVGARIIDVDMAAVTFAGCDALNVIASHACACHDRGGHLGIVRSSGPVERVIRLTGLHDELIPAEPAKQAGAGAERWDRCEAGLEPDESPAATRPPIDARTLLLEAARSAERADDVDQAIAVAQRDLHIDDPPATREAYRRWAATGGVPTTPGAVAVGLRAAAAMERAPRRLDPARASLGGRVTWRGGRARRPRRAGGGWPATATSRGRR